tara:strand:+ start:237 stop:2228 length:1992 start_codon:yes stop_codon:yes gene_type:complete
MEQLIFFLLFSFFSTTSEDKIKGLADTQSQYSSSIGYTDKTSYQIGDTIRLYLSNDSLEYKPLFFENIFRDTIYISDSLFLQPQQVTNPSPWKEGFGYEISININTDKLQQGVYFVEEIPIIINDSSKNDEIIVLIPTATMAAYTSSGGKSFYVDYIDGTEQANTLSFQRPHRTINKKVLRVEPFLFWLENNYDNITYISDYDLNNGFDISGAKIFIITGHSEFWSKQQRIYFDDFIDNGGNALILSGNTMWKQIKYLDDGLRVYTYWLHHPNNGDPLGATGAFQWPHSDYPIEPSIGSSFRDGGYGDVNDNGWDGFKVIKENSPIFSNTFLNNGDIFSIQNRELDGRPILYVNSEGLPVWDYESVHNRGGAVETVAYDRTNWSLQGDLIEKFPGIIVYKKNCNSGTIVNTGAMNWCYENGFNGQDSIIIRKITSNMIDLLKNNENLFSEDILHNSSNSTQTITACDEYTWIDGITYTESNNTATYTLTNSAGCDSVVTLDLTINPSPEKLIINQYWSTSLKAGKSFAYQWYLNGEVLENDTAELLNFIKGGSYTVEAINSFGCKTMSEAFVIGTLERNFDAEIDFMIYPNPTKNLVFIELMEEFGTDGKIIVSNLVGQILKIIELKESYSSLIDFSIFKNGQYVITVKYSNGLELSKTINKY